MTSMQHTKRIASSSRYALAGTIACTVVVVGILNLTFFDRYFAVEKPQVQGVLPHLEEGDAQNPPVVIPTQKNPLFAAEPSWVQDFSGPTGSLDPRYWSTVIGPAENSNREQQYYTDNSSNLRIKDGALWLTATHQEYPGGYQYGSVRLETIGKQNFLYGRIDITAKLPRGVGTWPAVWLLPATDVYASMSPLSDPFRYKNGGEIDILEAVGFLPDSVYGVVHTKAGDRDHVGSHSIARVPNSDTTFNTYTLLWTPTTLTFEVNGRPYHTYTRSDTADYMTWPFDQPFYLIANVALGGTWGGMDTKNFPGNGIDNAALPASMAIRSIYYYPYIGESH